MLGVQVPYFPLLMIGVSLFLHSSMAEQPTVNRQVPGSSPGVGALPDPLASRQVERL